MYLLNFITVKFPSPYGVLFILIVFFEHHPKKVLRISVSLWSIIHSYGHGDIATTMDIYTHFRLLTELYSFL